MANICPKCFEQNDIFHSCASRDVNSSGNFDVYESENSASLFTTIIIAPFAGLILDFFLNIPSSFINSILLSLLGSAIILFLWVSVNYKGKKSAAFYLKNAKNFIASPNILRIFSLENKRNVWASWWSSIAIATILQIIFVSPGNANYLEERVSRHIHDVAGVTLKVSCPRSMLFFYTNNFDCRVNTGVLGIKFPAHLRINPILGNSTIKVSLQ